MRPEDVKHPLVLNPFNNRKQTLFVALLQQGGDCCTTSAPAVGVSNRVNQYLCKMSELGWTGQGCDVSIMRYCMFATQQLAAQVKKKNSNWKCLQIGETMWGREASLWAEDEITIHITGRVIDCYRHFVPLFRKRCLKRMWNDTLVLHDTPLSPLWWVRRSWTGPDSQTMSWNWSL